MSRIKPHGPVSPHFMNHYYGAAKPAPASDDTTLLRQALEALESCDAQHPSDGGRQWYDSEAVDAAIAALRERLGVKA